MMFGYSVSQIAPCLGAWPLLNFRTCSCHFLYSGEPDFCRPRLHADGLHAVVAAEFPAQVVAADEVAQARMEGLDVVILQVDLDEGLPVVVALVHFDVVEHVAREVEVLRDRHLAQLVHDVVAVLLEQQAVPVLQRRLRQVQAGRVREMRRADQFALQVVGPAVQRADDVVGVAAAIEHQRLAVAADVGQQLDALRCAPACGLRSPTSGSRNRPVSGTINSCPT
jgi:hypothetical protein